MRPNDAMPQTHVADNASWFQLTTDRASFLAHEVPILVTGGAIIARHPIVLLLVPVSSFLRPMADVLATTWTMAIPLVCLVSLHGGWAWARYLGFCCSCLCFLGR